VSWSETEVEEVLALQRERSDDGVTAELRDSSLRFQICSSLPPTTHLT